MKASTHAQGHYLSDALSKAYQFALDQPKGRGTVPLPYLHTFKMHMPFSNPAYTYLPTENLHPSNIDHSLHSLPFPPPPMTERFITLCWFLSYERFQNMWLLWCGHAAYIIWVRKKNFCFSWIVYLFSLIVAVSTIYDLRDI